MNSSNCESFSSEPLGEQRKPELGEGDGLAARRVHLLKSDALFNGANEVEIEHHGALYRLRKTSLGKLILTK